MIQGHIRSQRRQRKLEGKLRYKYRGLPCNVRPHHEMFYVAGRDGNAGGILEWCVDQHDAEDRLRIMRGFPQFMNLRVGNNAEDDIRYAQNLHNEMNINPNNIPREKFRRAIFSCIQVQRNIRAWKPMRATQEVTEHTQRIDRQIAAQNVEQIKAWRGIMRKIRRAYYAPENTGRETLEAREARRQANLTYRRSK